MIPHMPLCPMHAARGEHLVELDDGATSGSRRNLAQVCGHHHRRYADAHAHEQAPEDEATAPGKAFVQPLQGEATARRRNSCCSLCRCPPQSKRAEAAATLRQEQAFKV